MKLSEFLKTGLPEELRTTPQGISTYDAFVSNFDKEYVDSWIIYIDDAIDYAFTWKKTKEDYIFWMIIHKKWREQENKENDMLWLLYNEPIKQIDKPKSIDETLKERGSIYGSFEHQAECVGKIIKACIETCESNSKGSLMDAQLGSIAYIAIKLARFAIEPKGDTSHDLHGYARLIDELYNGDK